MPGKRQFVANIRDQQKYKGKKHYRTNSKGKYGGYQNPGTGGMSYSTGNYGVKPEIPYCCASSGRHCHEPQCAFHACCGHGASPRSGGGGTGGGTPAAFGGCPMGQTCATHPGCCNMNQRPSSIRSSNYNNRRSRRRNTRSVPKRRY